MLDDDVGANENVSQLPRSLFPARLLNEWHQSKPILRPLSQASFPAL